MSIYKTYDTDQLEELQSQFLVSSWSYSKVTTFARNEKAFEMSYIFGLRGKNSATTVAGSAYHEALQAYFEAKKAGNTLGIAELEQVAFDYIDGVKGNDWKLQKTTPTIDECRVKATKTAVALIQNFLNEKYVYEDDISEVIGVEVYMSEYVTINGVDIPLPCHCMIDLIVKTKSGNTAIIDHKSKNAYTPEDEIALSIGIQAITYIKAYESNSGDMVSEVWFVENKYSQNKDKSPQLVAFKVSLDDNTRALYESLLYEPLRRMISATNDPDYVYMINDSDNYVDRAELYDFWARTMISEVEEFNVEESKKELVSKRLKKIRDSNAVAINPKVIKEFKANAASFIQYDLSNTNMTQSEKIEHVLRSFGVIVKVAHVLNGYSCDTYLLEVSAGVKITSVQSHRLDMANALDVPNVRVSSTLVMHEGKSYLSIETSKKRDGVLYFDPEALKDKRIPLGIDNYNNPVIWDLNNNSTPHVLICGATGSGKSVSVKSTIEYALLANVDEVVIFDPKHEFVEYKRRGGVSVYNDILDIEVKMAELVVEMNELVREGKRKTILVVFDEFADAVAQSRKGAELDIRESVVVGMYKSGFPKMQVKKTGELKSLEENLRILLQKGRSSGFRIVAATQRASVKVITGDAKVNFPVQICFRVPKEADSRVVLDEPGAESLAGMGDGLIKSPEYTEVKRFQAYYKPDTILVSGDTINNQSLLIAQKG